MVPSWHTFSFMKFNVCRVEGKKFCFLKSHLSIYLSIQMHLFENYVIEVYISINNQ